MLSGGFPAFGSEQNAYMLIYLWKIYVMTVIIGLIR